MSRSRSAAPWWVLSLAGTTLANRSLGQDSLLVQLKVHDSTSLAVTIKYQFMDSWRKCQVEALEAICGAGNASAVVSMFCGTGWKQQVLRWTCPTRGVAAAHVPRRRYISFCCVKSPLLHFCKHVWNSFARDQALPISRAYAVCKPVKKQIQHAYYVAGERAVHGGVLHPSG